MLIDERVLTADFLPAEILHRHDEIKSLSRTLQPISDGEIDSGAGAFIWGPTGTGKTCTTRHLLEKLSETATVDSAIVDCWQQQTSAALYYTLLNEIDPGHTRKRGVTPTAELWDRLDDHIENQFVIVLDEADQLQDQQALYQFYEHDLITPILIANRKLDFFVELDDRVNSRLRGYTAIHFQNYSDDELVAILQHRADAALRPGAVSDKDISTIAKHAHGDARLAIGILRNAVRNAEGESLESHHITAAIGNAQNELRQNTLEKLSDVQRRLFGILVSHGEQSLSELYDRYAAQVEDPMVKRTIRNHLSKMADYDLIRRHGENRGRTYESTVEAEPSE